MAPHDPIYLYLKLWLDVRTYDVIKVVCTCHCMRGFLSRYLVLKIKPNTSQTIDTTDKRERRKNMSKSEGPNSDCNIEIFL